MADKFRLTCEGKSSAEGGLTIEQLQSIVQKQQPSLNINGMSTDRLLDYACYRLCPTSDYVGALDIISDIDVDPTKKFYTYKGENIELSDIVEIASGTFGEVYKASFEIDGETMFFAIKYSLDKNLEEAQVVQEYTDGLDCPGIISMKVREIDGEDVAIMPLADGSLHDYLGKFSHTQANHIINVIQEALLCLYDNNCYYFDIKPANILFNCDSSGISTIFLGDIGSILPNENDEYATTFPPIMYSGGYIPVTDEALSIYTYQLCVLYCYLITNIVPPLWGTKPEDYYNMIANLAQNTLDIVKTPNKYITTLSKMAEDMNMSSVKNLDAF